MPTTRVEPFHCGTDWSGWLDGAHPTVENGEVQRTVCFSNRESETQPCKYSEKIFVKNCESYFIYKLVKLTKCESRYCATDWMQSEKTDLSAGARIWWILPSHRLLLLLRYILFTGSVLLNCAPIKCYEVCIKKIRIRNNLLDTVATRIDLLSHQLRGPKWVNNSRGHKKLAVKREEWWTITAPVTTSVSTQIRICNFFNMLRIISFTSSVSTSRTNLCFNLHE